MLSSNESFREKLSPAFRRLMSATTPDFFQIGTTKQKLVLSIIFLLFLLLISFIFRPNKHGSDHRDAVKYKRFAKSVIDDYSLRERIKIMLNTMLLK